MPNLNNGYIIWFKHEKPSGGTWFSVYRESTAFSVGHSALVSYIFQIPFQVLRHKLTMPFPEGERESWKLFSKFSNTFPPHFSLI